MEEKGLDGMVIEEYRYSESDFISSGITWKEREKHVEDTGFFSPFDKALQSKWTEKMNQGLFRYPLQNVKTRILPGRFKYVAQLNIERSINRRKPENIWCIQQKFNPNQFNYNKIKPEEILFQMTRAGAEDANKVNAECRAQVNGTEPPESSDGLSKATHQSHCLLGCKSNSTLVVINVSPLEFGHVLFMPSPSLCLPQILSQEIILFGMESVLLSAHPGFRVGFNSLGGLASVNHLHLHGYYLDQELLLESSCSRPMCPEISLHLLTDFPAPGFLFYTDWKDLKSTAQNICKVTDFLVAKNIAHNLFVTRGNNPDKQKYPESRHGIRIVIWARKSSFGAKELSAFNVALCELAGHLPIKNQEAFENITEDSVISIITKHLLEEDTFTQLSLDLMAYFRK